MAGKILLVTVLDETHRKLLLESQGYRVTAVRGDSVLQCLAQDSYQLVLATTEDGLDIAQQICANVKRHFPDVRLAIFAQRAEYVPATVGVDAVIREQHQPAKFLSIVKKLMETAGGQSVPASTGK